MMNMNYGKRGQLNTNQNEAAKCMICSVHKFQLHKRKSKLMPNLDMLVCTDCFNSKKEPRWLIILTAQSGGVSVVKKYLENQMYHGPEISALELLK